MCTININLKNGSNLFQIELSKFESIQTLKHKLSELTKIRSNNLLVLINGCFLENNSILDDYGIEDGDTLQYEMKLCGPKPIDFDWSKLGVPSAPKKTKALVKKVTEI